MFYVITYQSTSDNTINICPSHIDKLRADHCWPRDRKGEEYCSVKRGFHRGTCAYCDDEDNHTGISE